MIKQLCNRGLGLHILLHFLLMKVTVEARHFNVLKSPATPSSRRSYRTFSVAILGWTEFAKYRILQEEQKNKYGPILSYFLPL